LIALIPSRSTLGTNKTTRTRLRPPPNTDRRPPDFLVFLVATHDQYRSFHVDAQTHFVYRMTSPMSASASISTS
jgi:hypothetical protein